MSNIKFDYERKRVAIVIDNQKRIPVGEVEEWDEQTTPGIIHVNVRLAENLPEALSKAIEKNPRCLQILEILSPPKNHMIIPSRPKLVIPQ